MKTTPVESSVRWHFGPSPSVKSTPNVNQEPSISVENLLKILSQQFTKYEDLVGNLNDIKIQRAFSKELVEFNSDLEKKITAKEIITEAAIVRQFENRFLKRIQDAAHPVNNLMFKTAASQQAADSKSLANNVDANTINPKSRST